MKKSKKKASKKKIIIIIIAIVAIVIVGLVCLFIASKKNGTTIKESITGPTGRSYLTGEAISESIEDNRPYAVMIENTKDCQNTYGLSSAGVILEAPAEGGITRLEALFDDMTGVEKIGNVRSCRPYYAYFAAEFDAIYAHYGQSAQGLEVLNSGIVDNISGLGSASSVTFFRGTEHKAPHNAYTTPDMLKAGAEKLGYRTTYNSDYTGHFTFAEDDETVKLSDGEDCQVICPYYYNNKPRFEYNSSTGLYERYQFGGKQIDGNNNEQVTVKNIIFQYVDSSKYEGGYYTNLSLLGKGSGKYFTNGKMIDITWSKNSYEGITTYYDADGNEITLNQGHTWVCYIENSGVSKNKYYATVDEYNTSK